MFSFDMKSIILALTLNCLLVGCVTSCALGQTGSWVLDGWPEERNGFFAGRTVIYADGERLKITEWPENSVDDSESMETYFLGRTGLKVFSWQGQRVGLVFESNMTLPRALFDAEGSIALPHPYPSRVGEEGVMTCGDGCMYHVRAADFTALDPSEFAPGGSLHHIFAPDETIPLMTREEFLDRFRILPPEWASWE